MASKSVAASAHDGYDEERALGDWIDSIRLDLADLSESSLNRSIFRVPQGLRNTNPSAYTPYIISIGPLHHQNGDHPKGDLLPMEYHKWNYLNALLKRTKDPHACLEECSRSMFGRANATRECYADTLFYDNFVLAEMMLLDGCFMLELFIRYGERCKTDPIFRNAWMVCTLRRDFALLENQIPFSVLQRLFSILSHKHPSGMPTSTLHQLALEFYRLALNLNPEVIQAQANIPAAHLLDLLRNCYIPSPQTINSRSTSFEFMHTATEIRRAGVDFQSDSKCSLFEIDMSPKGVIRIPPLYINDATESLFRNLIAFEQCSYNSTHYITSFIFFMDRLINTPADVELLERKNIINNDLGSSEEVSKLFNAFCKEVVLKDFYFAGLCKKVGDYYGKRRHRYMAILKRNHCTNPWTILSLISVFIILFLTALQSTYSSLSYHHPPK